MTERNMWGDLEKIELVKTPVSYLREQASLLSEQTSYNLNGVVRTINHPGYDFAYVLVILAPKLKYEFSVAKIAYSLSNFYPLYLRDYVNNEAGLLLELEPFHVPVSVSQRR